MSWQFVEAVSLEPGLSLKFGQTVLGCVEFFEYVFYWDGPVVLAVVRRSCLPVRRDIRTSCPAADARRFYELCSLFRLELLGEFDAGSSRTSNISTHG